MAVARSNGGVTSSSTDGVCAFGFTATSGRLLIASMMERSGAAHTAHTATAGWTKAAGVTGSTDATYRRSGSVWYKVSNGTETTVTIGDGSANTKRVTVEEFSGQPADFLSGIAAGNGDTANGESVSSGTTPDSVSGDLFVWAVLWVKNDGSAREVTAASWTNGPNDSNAYQVNGGVFGRQTRTTFGEVAGAGAGARETTVSVTSWNSGSAENSGLMAALLVWGTSGGGGSVVKDMISMGFIPFARS